MNWRFEADVKRHGIAVYADGCITAEELLMGANTILSSPAASPDVRILLDFQMATEFNLGARDLIALASLPSLQMQARRAVVVKRGLHQGFFQLYRMYGARGSIEVFDNRRDALDWLNRERGADEQLRFSD